MSDGPPTKNDSTDYLSILFITRNKFFVDFHPKFGNE